MPLNRFQSQRRLYGKMLLPESELLSEVATLLEEASSYRKLALHL